MGNSLKTLFKTGNSFQSPFLKVDLGGFREIFQAGRHGDLPYEAMPASEWFRHFVGSATVPTFHAYNRLRDWQMEIEYIGKLLPDGHLSLPPDVWEKLKVGDTVRDRLTKQREKRPRSSVKIKDENHDHNYWI